MGLRVGAAVVVAVVAVTMYPAPPAGAAAGAPAPMTADRPWGRVAAASTNSAAAKRVLEALVPHRAVYKVALGSATTGSGITGARGAMLYHFADTCDAWTVENRIYLRMEYEEGEDVETTWAFASWEAKSGQSYRFRVRQHRDGENVETLQGRALLHGAKKGLPGRPRSGGVANFSEPPDTDIELPKGAMFPTRHLLALLDAARAGSHRFSRVVFDGSSLDNPFEINAIIDKVATRPRKPVKGVANLVDGPTWRMHMAFFPHKSQGPSPEFEMSVRYREDGIAEEIHQDFGNFTLDLVPQEIKILAAPEC